MSYEPVITKTAMIFNLQKPIYGSHYGLWDKWTKIARKQNLNIIVNTQFGKVTYTYASYMKGAVLKKRFYKNPAVPMRFWCRDMLPDIKARNERKKQEADNQFIKEDLTPSGSSRLISAWKEALKRRSVITT